MRYGRPDEVNMDYDVVDACGFLKARSTAKEKFVAWVAGDDANVTYQHTVPVMTNKKPLFMGTELVFSKPPASISRRGCGRYVLRC